MSTQGDGQKQIRDKGYYREISKHWEQREDFKNVSIFRSPNPSMAERSMSKCPTTNNE